MTPLRPIASVPLSLSAAKRLPERHFATGQPTDALSGLSSRLRRIETPEETIN